MNARAMPWALDRVPGYDRAASIPELDATTLSPDEFRRYWARNAPCLVKGAVRSWPAFDSWQRPEFAASFVDRLGDLADWDIRSVRDTQVQCVPPPGTPAHARFAASVRGDTERWIPIRELAALLQDGGDEMLSWGPVMFFGPDSPERDRLRTTPPGRRNYLALFEAMSAILMPDIEGFRFLADVGPPDMYQRWRFFWYRASFTDWHFHRCDSHLMCQISGSKQVLLVAPNAGFRHLFEPLLGQISYELSPSPFADLSMYRVVVEPGDALHIPVYWWHAVEAMGPAPGFTVCYTFQQPSYLAQDPRFEINRSGRASDAYGGDDGAKGAVTVLACDAPDDVLVA